MTVEISSMDQTLALFGFHDQNIRLLEDELSVRVAVHDNALLIEGDTTNQEAAREIIKHVLHAIEQGETIDLATMRYYIDSAFSGDIFSSSGLVSDDVVAFTYRGRKIMNKTAGQRLYTDAIRTSQLTVAVGPAGTGKTFLAVALAVKAIKNKEVERLILTRPAVEAGEKLGFLPGDMSQKVDPYLRPLYDALFEMLGAEGYQKLIDRNMVEIAPLAFMRGRTLNDAFIILDEAQNTTPEQMKMFLTRMGRGSKCVVTGDLTQVDLPLQRKSGLKDALDLLSDIEEISIVRLTDRDVVRNDLVQKIVKAYEKRQEAKQHDDLTV